jgi:hypothetical protein
METKAQDGGKPANSLTAWEKAVWIGSFTAPLAGWALLMLFGLYVIRSDFRAFVGKGHVFAWILGALVIVALMAHFAVMRHAHRAEHFPHEARAELKRRLAFGHGHGHWRRLMRQNQKQWYKGRSHSGERPRYD